MKRLLLLALLLLMPTAAVADTVDVPADTIPSKVDANGAGPVTIGSPDVTVITLTTGTEVQIINGATGVVTFSLRDYADTDDDDMAHAIFSANCGTTGTGAEECDLNISITTGGANIEVIAIDPAGGIEIGDATTTVFTVTTDSTGDAEVVLPDDSIGNDELAVGAVRQEQIVSNGVALAELGAAWFTYAFCGKGANGSTDGYWSPMLMNSFISNGGDWSVGGTLCDDNDGTVVATEDEVPVGIGDFNYTLKWMFCSFVDASSTDDLTFTLFDDTSGLAAACTMTLSGSGIKTCDYAHSNVGLEITGGSEMAIEVSSDGSDNLTAAGNDGYCVVSGVIRNNN